MKNTLILFILWFGTLQLPAQIPDSLGVILPWEQVTISTCDAYMGEEPTTTNDAVNVYRDESEYFYNASGECIKKIKKWQILDWYGQKSYDVFQVGNVSAVAQTNCESEVYLTYDDLPLQISPEDLLLDLDPDHTYSFSHEDPGAKSSVLAETTDNVIEISVYNHTNSTVCRSTIYITPCEDEIVLDIPEKVEIEFNGEVYIALTLELLGVNIDYPCEPYTTKIRVVGDQNILFASSIGKSTQVYVDLLPDSGDVITKSLEVSAVGVKPDPIALYIEDVSFNAGETVEVEVWSEEVLELLAWQFQFQFENAKVIELEKANAFDAIPYNALNNNKTLRALWTPGDGLPMNIAENGTWFTIKLLPSIDGRTADIMSTEIDPWNSILINGDGVILQYEAEFIFNLAPRDILNSSITPASSVLRFFPNPAFETIQIEGLSGIDSSVTIDILDMKGRLQISHTITPKKDFLTLDISSLSNGIYILQTKRAQQLYVQKFVKM